MHTPYLLQRGNQYYFQLRLPADVQPYFCCTHLKKSLKTTNKRQAATKAKLLSFEIEKGLFMIRTGLLTPQMIQQIVSDIKEGMLEAHRRHGRKTKTNNAEQFHKLADKYRERIKQRDYSNVTEECMDQLELRNIAVDSNSREFLELCDAMLQTRRSIYEVMAAREEGNYNNRYDNDLTMKVREPKLRLSALMKDYLTLKKDGDGEGQYNRLEGEFKKIHDVLGDIYTCDLTKDVIKFLHSELRNYPKHRFSNPYAGKSLQECRKLPGFKAVHSTTFKGTWNDLSGLLRHGVQNEKYKILRNFADDKEFILSKKQLDQPLERAAYDQNDISCLFAGLAEVNLVRQPHRYWIPLISLYQGMRINEICQLYCDDILEIAGIPCIRITANPARKQIVEKPDNKRLKNESSRRTIPIHPTLLQLGFLDFVEDRRKRKYTRVWQNLKTPAVDYYKRNYSHYMSKWYCGTFRKNHIKIDPELKPFHSLRHTHINWYWQNIPFQELDFSAVKGIVGHLDTIEQRLIGNLFKAETWTTYVKEINAERLLQTLSKLDYGVDLELLKRRT